MSHQNLNYTRFFYWPGPVKTHGCSCSVAEVPSKKCYLPRKKMLLCVQFCVGGSNIFARKVTVGCGCYKKPSKMSTKTSVVRTPSTDSHVEVSTQEPSVLF